jgi:hypothetical protein
MAWKRLLSFQVLPYAATCSKNAVNVPRIKKNFFKDSQNEK